MITTERTTDEPRATKLVTIVTVVRNGRHLIGPTIESVLRLKSLDVEYVVRDGASTDGTQAVIESYAGVDVYRTAADQGIYDAMNDGARSATGKFILFLNAGDTLLSLPLQELRDASHDLLALSFPVLIDGVYVFRPSVGFKLRLTNTLHHQGTFYRRGSVPDYDLRYKVFSDYDLNTALARSGRVACYHAPTVAMHSADGVSNQSQSAAELFSIIRKWHGRSGIAASLLYFKLRGALWRFKIRI